MIDIFVIPDWGNLIAQWGATLVLFLIVRHFAYKPMKEFLAKRREQVASDIREAETAKMEAEQLKASYEEDMKNAREEGNRIVEESRARGKELERQLKEEGKEEAARILEKARSQIEKEKESAYREVKESTSDLAVAIAEKLIGENLSADKQRALVDDFIRKLETEHV